MSFMLSKSARRRGVCPILCLILVSVVFLASIAFFYGDLWEQFLTASVEPSVFGPAPAPATRTLVATRSPAKEVHGTTTQLSVPLPTANSPVDWEEEEFKPVVQVSAEPVSKSPLADPPSAQNSTTVNSTWVPVYNDPFDITRSIFYGIRPPLVSEGN
jgi:hypothetical protein